MKGSSRLRVFFSHANSLQMSFASGAGSTSICVSMAQLLPVLSTTWYRLYLSIFPSYSLTYLQMLFSVWFVFLSWLLKTEILSLHIAFCTMSVRVYGFLLELHCKHVMVISTLSGLSQLHLFRDFHSIYPHHATLGLKWPLHFLSWLPQLHLFNCSPHHAVHLFRGFHSSPHHAVHLFRGFYSSHFNPEHASCIMWATIETSEQMHCMMWATMETSEQMHCMMWATIETSEQMHCMMWATIGN